MPSADQNLSETRRLNEALQLVSGRLDRDLSTAEESRLKALEADFPRETAAFQKQCGNLHSALLAIPVHPVAGSLVASIPLAERELMAKRTIGKGQPLLRRTSVRATIGAAVLIGGLLFAFLTAADNSSQNSADGLLAAAKSSNSPAAASLVDADVTPVLGSDVNVLAESAFPSAADSGSATTDRLTADRLDAVRPFLQNEQWNIVVLKVTSKDRAAVTQQIHAILRSNGLRIADLNDDASHDKSDWLGVVLTSASDSGRKFVDDAIQQGVAESADWDPSEIADASQEELIDAFRRSLQFPTKSELYHGEVYVEVSRISSLSGAPLAVARNSDDETVVDAGSDVRAGDATSVNHATDPGPATDNLPGTPETETGLAKIASGVTLIVFQFQPDPIPVGTVESEGRI